MTKSRLTKMAWVYVFLAILLEVSGTTCMKLSDGLTRPTASVMMFVFYALSLGMLALVMREIEVSVVYALWSGLGTALIAVIGMMYFREPATALKIGCIAMIILGVVGLNLSGLSH